MRIVMFGHNRRDTAFVRRAQSLLAAGVSVTSFTFRRDGEPVEPGPAWANVDLGHVEHARFVERMFLYLRALRTVIGQRATIRDADVLHARNLDILLFALLSCRLGQLARRLRQTVVYECLDVHEKLIGQGVTARLLRFVERLALRRADLLVVSSPGFIANYFEPTQGFRGRHVLVENKLYFGADPVQRPASTIDAGRSVRGEQDDRLTLGWVGIIRCQRTLDLLKALAGALPERVTIRISGLVSRFLIEAFEAQIAAYPNIEFSGPYEWPSGLAEAYRGIDLVWAQELSWSGGNSDWLIPNRVYEASYFGVPSLAVGETQTARTVRERRLGYVLARESADELIAFVRGIDLAELRACGTDLLRRPAEDFVAGRRDTEALVTAIRDARR